MSQDLHVRELETIKCVLTWPVTILFASAFTFTINDCPHKWSAVGVFMFFGLCQYLRGRATEEIVWKTKVDAAMKEEK